MKAFNVEESINQKRRAIYTTLIETFPQTISKSRYYFAVWQREHGQDHGFVAMRFAAAVATQESFSADEKLKFQRLLFANLARPYEDLPRVPGEWLDLPPKKPNTNTTSPTQAVEKTTPISDDTDRTPGRVIFREFAQVLTEAILVKADQHKNLLVQVIKDLRPNLKDHNLVLLAMLARWASLRFNMNALPKVYKEQDLRYVAHLLYLVAADIVGPMQADKLLAQAIAKAERLPEASQFSPQQLL
jgi:hypothetical protein